MSIETDKNDVGNVCPKLSLSQLNENGELITYLAPCIRRKCAWYQKFRGKDPQTEQEIDHWGCSAVWQPILQTEMTQAVNGTHAAINSLRNDMMKEIEKSKQEVVNLDIEQPRLIIEK